MSWNNITPAWALDRDKPVKYAVMIDFNEDEWMYVLDSNPSIEGVTPVKLFDTWEEAQAHARQWNTGRVVVWHDGDK